MGKINAIFLDRDGTIIHDVGYPKDPKQVELLPGVIEALKSLKKHRFKLIVVSNQSGIGRGILTLNEVEQVNEHIVSILEKNGISIDATYYCPHAPEEQCSCRKPSPEMLLLAAKALDIDVTHSFMVGDKESDIEAGKRAGCGTILLENNSVLNNFVPMPDFIASNWSEALLYILGKSPDNVERELL
ncbi:MAG: HAD family hydrolase [Proteobacteria bacterium]|nr:HAD family hydrolase [Pseudomonadota bacterium]